MIFWDTTNGGHNVVRVISTSLKQEQPANHTAGVWALPQGPLAGSRGSTHNSVTCHQGWDQESKKEHSRMLALVGVEKEAQ